MNNRFKVILRIIIFALFYSLSGLAIASDSSVNARKDSIIKYKKPLDLKISAVGMNRISLAPNIITTIWGDSSEYNATLSGNGSELFLTSKLEENNNIALAVELSGGKVIDLLLHTTDDPSPKIIELNLQKIESKSKRLDKEVRAMLEAMQVGLKGKYYVREVNHRFKINNNSLFVKQNQLYQFGKLRGMALKLKNRRKKGVSIDVVNVLKSFRNLLAIQIDEMILKPGQETTAFLVMEEENI